MLSHKFSYLFWCSEHIDIFVNHPKNIYAYEQWLSISIVKSNGMLFSSIFEVFEICTPLVFSHSREPVHNREFPDSSLLAVSGAESECCDKNKIYVNSVAVERNSKVFGMKHLLFLLVHTLPVSKALLTKICIKLWP